MRPPMASCNCSRSAVTRMREIELSLYSEPMISGPLVVTQLVSISRQPVPKIRVKVLLSPVSSDGSIGCGEVRLRAGS